MKTTFYRYRSSVTGRFVSAEYAKKHPRETQREAAQRKCK